MRIVPIQVKTVNAFFELFLSGNDIAQVRTYQQCDVGVAIQPHGKR
jgi:hypothetical protein